MNGTQPTFDPIAPLRVELDMPLTGGVHAILTRAKYEHTRQAIYTEHTLMISPCTPPPDAVVDTNKSIELTLSVVYPTDVDALLSALVNAGVQIDASMNVEGMR